MSELALLAASPDDVLACADPAQFVVLACERAKSWLKQALDLGDIDQIVEMKSQAEAIRVYTAQKQMGHDAELAAAEIVRRAERGIGVCIRKGQDEGTISRKGTKSYNDVVGKPTDFAAPHELSGNDNDGIYALTDGVTDEQFDAAVEEAKAEKNLSRANVVRKVRNIAGPETPVAQRVDEIREMAEAGHTAGKIAKAFGVSEEHIKEIAKRNGIVLHADAVMGRMRRIDPNRVTSEAIHALEGVVMSLDLVNGRWSEVDDREEWATSLRQAIKSLQRTLKEMTL